MWSGTTLRGSVLQSITCFLLHLFQSLLVILILVMYKSVRGTWNKKGTSEMKDSELLDSLSSGREPKVITVTPPVHLF